MNRLVPCERCEFCYDGGECPHKEPPSWGTIEYKLNELESENQMLHDEIDIAHNSRMAVYKRIDEAIEMFREAYNLKGWSDTETSDKKLEEAIKFLKED